MKEYPSDQSASFTALRDAMRWRVALVLSSLQVVLMIALGVLNTHLGLTDTANLAWLVLTVSAVCLALLLLLPRAIGATLFFSAIALLLILVPAYGLHYGRAMQYWAYIFPPLLVFLLPARTALVGMVIYGIYVVTILTALVQPIDTVRFASGYGLLVCFIYTYALLEERAVALLRYHSNHDALSNCLNRRTFNALLDKIAHGNAPDEPCTILLIDIDYFKNVNDQHGHLVGDRVITEVAEVLKQNVRMETAVFRYGGEEFAVLLNGRRESEGRVMAERLRTAVEAHDFNGIHITISIGVSQWQPGEISGTAALDWADKALYAAKRTGRNRVMLASDLA